MELGSAPHCGAFFYLATCNPWAKLGPVFTCQALPQIP